MAQSNLEFKTIKKIHEAYNAKKVSPLELTQDFFKSIKASKHNAYLTVCEERALGQAKAATQTLSKSGKVPSDQFPLFGIPLGLKDVLTLDGVRTTCASKIIENYIPPYTATAVERLEKAGSITLGKLNMDEFAMGGSNENSAFGPVLHPTHEGYVPGGSSGGSATAVKAGLCVAALGTDTGGSVRLPASYCGVVGLKPTYGRVSRYGLVAFASSLDQIGPLTHDTEDAARILDVMSGHDPKDSTSAAMPKSQVLKAMTTAPDWSKVKIGVPKEYSVGGLSPDVEKSLQESLKWFEKKGAKLIPISLPHTKYAVAIYYIVAVSEASSNLARFDGVRFGVRPKDADQSPDLPTFYKRVRSNFGPEVKRRIILGTFALSSGYYDAYYRRACQVRRLVKQDFEKAFSQVDVIISPVSPSTAFKLGEKSKDPIKMYLNDIFTIPVNLAGLPAMSVPCGQDHKGLPIGLQFTTPAFQEEKLFSMAHAFEVRT
ncbi:Asp-tRNA(Asn)/Glu-tRNA(Gln) amidotransferase subunit GatA [bacterium]|jgi:aspartyl-tRNA(Asn)/glutamyl-tRNA(Gln) amidotransferase subunit A|nr:Asp-tRNA(Asn)/Glu-tRNA(Gln) amidotransferase subunit GatA [bacterium]